MHFINSKCVWLLDKNWVLSLQAANPHVCECVCEREEDTPGDNAPGPAPSPQLSITAIQVRR